MGFRELIKKRKKKRADRNAPSDVKQFVASTVKEIRGYGKHARIEEETKKLRSKTYDSAKEKSDAQLECRRAEARVRERNYTPKLARLAMRLPIKNLNRKTFMKRYCRYVREHAERWLSNKKNDRRWTPKLAVYLKTGEPKLDDNNFVYDALTMLTNFSWKELEGLVSAALNEEGKTTDFIEAFWFARQLFLQVIGIDTDDAESRYRFTDRLAFFKLWPVSPQLKAGVKKVNLKYGEDEETRKLLAGRKKDADEEAEDDEDEEDEEDDEEEEDEEDDEDVKPKRKAKKKTAKKKKSSKDDEDEEEEEEDEDDDGDDEDEDEDESDDEDDGDEDGDSDEEDDEDEDDEKPSKRKGKVKAKKTAKKKAGKKKATAEKPDKKLKGKGKKGGKSKGPVEGEVLPIRAGSILEKALKLYSQKGGYSAVKLAKELKLAEGRTLCPALRRKGYIVKALGEGVFKASKPK